VLVLAFRLGVGAILLTPLTRKPRVARKITPAESAIQVVRGALRCGSELTSVDILTGSSGRSRHPYRRLEIPSRLHRWRQECCSMEVGDETLEGGRIRELPADESWPTIGSYLCC
jgi:hypothetical protein